MSNIIYYDLALTNTGNTRIPFEIKDQRNQIIEDPSQYEMSIVRFDICSELIPLFFPLIPDPLLPLQTNQSVTLRYLNNDFRQYIQVTADDIKNGIFDYQQHLNYINTAFLLAYTALKTAFPAADGLMAPKLYLNTITSLISLYVDPSYLSSNANRIKVGVNQPLHQILDFPCIHGLSFPTLNGFDCEIAVYDSAPLLPAAPRTASPFALKSQAFDIIQVSQEFRSLDEWSEIKSISFVSNLLPIAKEFIPTTVGESQNSSQNYLSEPIITDFLIAKDSVEPTRHRYSYVPSGEYRMISLVGTQPFNTIDVKGRYHTYDGRRRDLEISPQNSGTLKIMFRRIEKLL